MRCVSDADLSSIAAFHSSEPMSGPCLWPSPVGTVWSIDRHYESEQSVIVGLDVLPSLAWAHAATTRRRTPATRS
jgi:hypothetical protein